MKTIGARLRFARENKNLSQQALADKVGISQATIQNLESGVSKSSKHLISLAQALDIDPTWLGTGRSSASVIATALEAGHKHLGDLKNIGEENPGYTAQRAIPVVGTAELGDNGFWSDLEYPVGHGDGYIRWTSSDPSAYALKVSGDSMTPRIRHGEFVIIEPAITYAPGDEVLVKTTDGRSMVKVFLYTRDNRIHLDSINNGHGQVVLPVETIEKIHYVAGIEKRGLYSDSQ